MTASLDAALIALQGYEAASLVTTDANFKSAKTVPSAPISGSYPYMVHLPEGGMNSFITIDGDPPETSQAAPIQERTSKLKFRLLVCPTSKMQADMASVFDTLLIWIDALPTFYANKRMLGGVIRRLTVSEKEQGQAWRLTVWTFLGEEHICLEADAAITYDANVITGQ